MPNETLEIRWELNEPPVAPTTWRTWATAVASTAGDQALETRLSWPAGTLAVLREAFAKRLGRSTGWEGAAPALSAASAVFRRGVAYRPGGDATGLDLGAAPQLLNKTSSPLNKSPSTRSGCYHLTIHSGAEPPPQAVDPAAFTIIDAKVAAAWPKVVGQLRAAGSPLILGLDEHSKTLPSVATILAAAKEDGGDKPWCVIGGGLLADVSAFAAGLAGRPITFVPTTLLAMADACVGGKTGVNFAPYGKNQVGLFYFPNAVQVWTGWLATLPPRELHAGGAECLKHALLAGDLGLAEALAAALASGDLAELTPLLPVVIAYKAKIVAADPGENGQRAILNFGHTLAHALEAMAQKNTAGDVTLVHGEAVGLGMLFALILSHHVCGLPADSLAAAVALLRQAGCVPTREETARRLGVTDLAAPAVFAELTALIAYDKKNTAEADATAQWILLRDLGEVARDPRDPEAGWTIPVPTANLVQPWQDFLAALEF